MNEPNKIKHLSKRVLDSLFLERELSEPIIDLMHYERHLTEGQAKTTLNLFPEVDSAIAVANYFFSKNGIRNTFSNYNNYLSTIYQLVSFPEEKPCDEVESIFNEEIITRGSSLSRKVLTTLKYSSKYRSDPFDNSHQQEHFASQEDPETDSELEKAYLDRRSRTGL